MNITKNEKNVPELNLMHITGLRSGEKRRGQIFQINTDRLTPLNRGEDNEENVQSPQESNRNLGKSNVEKKEET